MAEMSDDEIRQEYEVLDQSKKEVKAFGILYEKYFDRIFRFIYRQTDDEELTADLCSQTFLIAMNNVGKYEFRGVPVSAWFYKIAGNEVNKYYRKRNTAKVFSLEEARVRELIAQENEDYDEERLFKLVEYMKDLPTDMIEVLQLRFFEGKEFNEIAFILEMSESGAKMRTYRALDRLRTKFNLTIKYDGKE
ncbi:MAG TPA: sigma-70 family RNA polymerase sigma factor [Cyclobacteriaceae bacterium]|nr:sigma-70 family RNA polymerase sigma factor [Cyclobacteriaceae bacterium]